MALDEVLVVDYQPDDDAPSWPVVAQSPPRVAVLRAAVEELTAIGSRARLAMARLPDGGTEVVGDEGVLEELDEGSGLFIAGWRAQAIDKPDRIGDGLAWDSPGFEPPDRPPD